MQYIAFHPIHNIETNALLLFFYKCPLRKRLINSLKAEKHCWGLADQGSFLFQLCLLKYMLKFNLIVEINHTRHLMSLLTRGLAYSNWWFLCKHTFLFQLWLLKYMLKSNLIIEINHTRHQKHSWGTWGIFQCQSLAQICILEGCLSREKSDSWKVLEIWNVHTM